MEAVLKLIHEYIQSDLYWGAVEYLTAAPPPLSHTLHILHIVPMIEYKN